MIKQVSWVEYFTVLAIGLLIYYAVVLFLYYRSDVLQLLNGKRKLVVAKPQSAEPGLHNDAFPDASTKENEEVFGEANRLIAELKEVFQHGYIKEELTMALQLKLREYQALKQTPFRVSINNYIESESEKRSIRLSEEDLRVLW